MSTYAPQQNTSANGQRSTGDIQRSTENETSGGSAQGHHRLSAHAIQAGRMGNQAFGRFIARTGAAAVRAKLRIGAPGDALEQEADRTADAIMSARPIGAPAGSTVAPAVRRSSRSAPGNVPSVTPAQQSAIDSMHGGGAPLAPATRSFFEPHFGDRLGDVRVHTDERAGSLASQLQANAFTVGTDIAFAPGRFAPETHDGRRLLAHELAHVAQNGFHGVGSELRREENKTGTPKPEDKKPDAGATPAVVPKDVPAGDAKDGAKPKLASNTDVVDLFKAIGTDLVFKKDFTKDERDKFKLKGNESASYYGLAGALVTPFSGMGGTKYNSNYDFGTNLGVFSRHLDAIEPLTPSLSLKTDLISRPFGLRVDEYLASDRFLDRLKEHGGAVTGLALLAQGVFSVAKGASTPTPDLGGYITQPWLDHLGLVKGMVGLVLKEPLKASTMFDLGPILMLSHPAFSADTNVGGNLPTGLRMEHAYDPLGKGSIVQGGLTLDPMKFMMPALDSRVAAGDMNDPRKYRGPQFNLWGDYRKVIPTTALQDAGRKPEANARFGAIVGTGGVFALVDAGMRYSGAEADKLTATFLSGGLGYAGGKDSVLKKIGLKVTHTSWQAGDVYAPPDAGGAPQAGNATRVQPFMNFDFKPAAGHKLSVGATLGVTSSTLESIGLSDFRGDISYTYLGNSGTDDMPMLRIELGYSRSRLDFWDPNSPTLTGLYGKGQVGRFFVGGQLNLGADAIPKDRAAQAAHPRDDDPKAQAPAAGALIVTGYMF